MLESLLMTVHKDIFSQLKALFEKQSLPHAMLFIGPAGIGKKHLALEFAKIILPDNFNAELHVFSPETAMHNYSIDQIRKIQDICQVKPYNGTYRVIILDQADRLGLQPSNAFLKLLEEPPEGNYFILISSQAYKILPTLLSRLQKFQFKKPTATLFKTMLDAEGLDLGGLVFLADGSIGKAQLVYKYKKYLEGFTQLLPHSYRSELASYKQLLETLDEDEEFNALEFLPLFESLLLDYYGYTSGYKDGQYSWSHLKSNSSLSYINLKKALSELTVAKEANMKTSCCFDKFFFSI